MKPHPPAHARRFVFAFLACAAAAGPARAADPASTPAPPPTPVQVKPGQGPDRPWAAGVSAEKQKAALERLQEGNVLLKESLFVEAAKKYREALEAWDHPGIHYNLALALLNLDQPLEVHQQLESAIKYGAAPLDADKYEHARSYLKLIEKQLASLEIHCELDGATVTLDGKAVFVAPGDYKGLVRPGPHTVTAEKAGYPTTERTKILLPGEPTTINLRLYTAGELIEYRRRWPLWRPVTVTALGGALIAAGVVLTIEARNKFNSYDNAVTANCPSGGCLPNTFIDTKNKGDTLQNLATVAYVAGGVALAAGISLLVVDRAVPYRLDPEGQRRDVASREPAWTPFLAPGMAGFVGRF
jgi:tetratricopeptide (TPR) repeat protein